MLDDMVLDMSSVFHPFIEQDYHIHPKTMQWWLFI